MVCSHALAFKENYSAAAMVLLRNIYMDDILHPKETEGDVVLICEDLTKVLGDAGFCAQ